MRQRAVIYFIRIGLFIILTCGINIVHVRILPTMFLCVFMSVDKYISYKHSEINIFDKVDKLAVDHVLYSARGNLSCI